jgi:hypothetical protein
MKSVVLITLALAVVGAGSAVPQNHHRGPEQTFLTVPEWFLVFSPEEYAIFLRDNPPSRFPFFGHIGQFWQSYAAVTEATSTYPFNTGYHVMVSVIGLSTTVEYGLKGLYERLIGHFTELTSGGADTAEDAIAAATAQSYVDFIKHTPWYEFDFTAPLANLWTKAGATGAKPWRKWERKYALTSEYAVKSGYAWLIGKATRASYERPSSETYAVVNRQGSVTLTKLPRYQAFTDQARILADNDTDFVEIAGNRGDILASVIAPSGTSVSSKTRILYRQPILTQPEKERQALVVRVEDLGEFLRSTPSSMIIEHIYDF